MSVVEQSLRPCIRGPYLYEMIEGAYLREGLGMISGRMKDTLLLGKILNLSYVLNHDWFDSEHDTDYSHLFALDEDLECTSEHIFNKNNSHIQVFDVHTSIAYNTFPELDVVSLCWEYFSDGFVDVGRLLTRMGSRENTLARLIDMKQRLSSSSTVFVIHRSYSEYLPGDHFAAPCGRLIGDPYHRQRERDNLHGWRRFIPEDNDHLVIVLYLRWGDKHTQFMSMADTGIGDALHILQRLLRDRHSRLYGFTDYTVYFLSEAAHTLEDTHPVNTQEFQFILDAFPPSKVQLRLNHSQYLDDFELATSADVFITPSESTFGYLLASLLEPHSVVIRPDNELWTTLLSRDNQSFLPFNAALCPSNRVPSLRRRCRNLDNELSHVKSTMSTLITQHARERAGLQTDLISLQREAEFHQLAIIAKYQMLILGGLLVMCCLSSFVMTIILSRYYSRAQAIKLGVLLCGLSAIMLLWI
jgi:hypothetical protein